MSGFGSILKRLTNLRDYINDNNPKDKWILSSLEPKIIELLKTNLTEEEETRIVKSLNKIIDTYEFRYNKQFEKLTAAGLEEVKFCPQCLVEYITERWNSLQEAEYKGRKVPLGKPMKGDKKKFKVYVKNQKGNVVKVEFGQPGVKIKKNNPARRRSFRARHHCDTNPGPRWKARYWSCRKW